MELSEKSRAYIYGITAVIFWSTVASAFKITLRYLSMVEMLLYSSFVSTLVLFLFLIISGKYNVLRKCTGRDYLNSAVLGFLNPFFYYLILFKAYSLLPAQQAQPLNFTWAIVLVLLSIPILKQRIRFVTILATFISFFGALIIATEGNIAALKFKSGLGVALAVGSSLIWAIYWIYNTKDRREAVVKLFLNFCFGFLFTFIYFMFFSEKSAPHFYGILGAVYIGLFEMGITFVLWLKALRLAPTTAHVSILIYLAPFISFIFIRHLVGEEILTSSVIGLFFIVGGILLHRIYEMKRKTKNG